MSARQASQIPPRTLASRTQAWGPTLARLVVAWQRQHGRHDLPWQREREPYRVWLSEIMLQQTQVSTVLGYYARFLQRFPTVADVARAELDEVLALWAGLGYYSRARHLHRCARVVMSEHGGVFPRTAAELATLPGIGPSTAAAIAAFCFGERAAILDGNVKRVLSRALGYGGDLAQARYERELWAAACALLPEAPGDMPAYTQGLMDLGATVCVRRNPACGACPLGDGCVAASEGQAEAYPIKTRKLQRRQRESWWLWLEHHGCVWLQQRPATGVWAGLWSLPLFDTEAQLSEALDVLKAQRPCLIEPQPMIDHALTHFDWRLHPVRVSWPEAGAAVGDLAGFAEGNAGGCFGAGLWVPRDRLAQHGLPAPLKRLLAL